MIAVIMTMALLLAAALQGGLPAFAFMGQARPPLLLAVVLYYALHHDTVPMLWAALAAGFLQDAASGMPMGVSAVCFGLAGLATGTCRRHITREHLVPHSLLGAAAAFAVTMALYVVLRLRGDIVYGMSWALLKAFWTAIFGMWWVPILCLILGWADRVVGNTQRERNAAEIEQY